MSQQSYDLKAIEAISPEDTLAPTIPVAIALQEASDLFYWCQPDLELLVKAGLDPQLVSDLPSRTAALRHIQSVWLTEFKSAEENQREWSRVAPEAVNLKKELIHHFMHAYRKHPNLLVVLQRISKGTGFADMLQDLSDLSFLGQSTPEPLQRIHFDFTLIDKAELLSQELAPLHAKVKAVRLKGNETKQLRDKAFTYLKQAVDEIREHGQYVFWRNPERSKGYISQFLKQKNNKKKRKNQLSN